MENAVLHLEEVIKDNLTLMHFERRVELAQDYYDYYTGDLDDKLQRMLTRETEDEFTQRKTLTNHTTKSTLNSTKLPFQKACRKKPSVKSIDYDTKGSDKKILELNEFIERFHGDMSLDEYMETMLVEYNFIDPNAFLIIEFEPNTELEKAKPYPFIASSDQVVDYEYINGELDYLIVKLPIQYFEGKDLKDGHKYTFYNGNETIVYRQVGEGYELQQNESRVSIGNRFFAVTIYQVRTEGDPDLKPAAIQFGYVRDPETNYETFLSVFDCALPLLRKTIKVNSENDQTMAMMAFPQRFMYVPPCNNPNCYQGKLPDNKTCPVCGGTGNMPVHKGSQDIITLALPKTPEEMRDLEKMLVYKTPPIELLQHQGEYLDKIKIDVHKTIFNVDVFTRSDISTTATEKILDTDNMNDTLHGFVRKYSQIWQKVVYFCAVFTDNAKESDKIIIQHEFPSDLKMKGLKELMEELKLAKDSNAAPATIAAIENDINEILYADRPDDLNRIRKQAQFNPFNGYSPEDIKYFISSGMVDKFTQTLYANYVRIWGDLEREHESPWIYDMEDKKIWELLEAKVQEIMDRIEQEKPKLLQLNFNQGNEEDQNEETEKIA